MQTLLPDLCGCPGYLASVLVPRATGGGTTLPEADFVKWWSEHNLIDADAPTCVYEVLKQPQNNCLVKDDFNELMHFILRHHPGLEFLQVRPLLAHASGFRHCLSGPFVIN